MNVNGVSNNTLDIQTRQTKVEAAKNVKEVSNDKTSKEETGAVYEPSMDKKPNGLYKQNTAVVNQMKADSDQRLSQMQNIVSKLLNKQATASNKYDDMWKLLSGGNLKVDPQTVADAKAEISEDGYWGVKQTSDRIVDFAKALTGGDPSKIDLMRDAFKKGYQEATKSWGKELPGISKDTYDAVMEKFEAWEKETQTEANESSKQNAYETTGTIQ